MPLDSEADPHGVQAVVNGIRVESVIGQLRLEKVAGERTEKPLVESGTEGQSSFPKRQHRKFTPM